MSGKNFSIWFLLFAIFFSGVFFVSSPRTVFAAEVGGGQTLNQVAGSNQETKDTKIAEQFFDFAQEQGLLFFDGLDAYGSFVAIAFFLILLIFFVASLTTL